MTLEQKPSIARLLTQQKTATKIRTWASQLKRVAVVWLKKCWLFFAVLFVTFALLFTLFRALTPWVKQYKSEVEQHLSILLGQPVTINDLETSWYWFQPVLKMDDVTISDANDHVLKLNKLLIGINLLRSLWHWQIKPGVLYVDNVHVTVRQVHTHWEIDGLKSNHQTMTFDEESSVPILGWLLAQDTIVIKHVSAVVHFNEGKTLSFTDFNMKAVHSYGHLRFYGGANLNQTIKTSLSVIADLQVDSALITKPKGHVYVSLQHFVPAQWQAFFPDMPYHISNGEGNLQLWFDLVRGHVSGLQAIIQTNNFSWVEDGKAKPRSIEQLNANVAWKSTNTGWQLTADQIHLHAGGVIWPENALSLEWLQTKKTYRAFVKTIWLAPVLAADIAWPNDVLSLLAMHPVGKLHDSQFQIQQGKIVYILTRFDQFGWRRNKEIPSVRHLSGVLYWQPSEGRLEIDGENTVIAPQHNKPLTFGLFNAAFDWKMLSNGLRVTMDRFVLSHPNLVVSASGAIDNASVLSASNLRLNTEFATKNAAPLLAYIPARYLKPKLNTWLKKDVKRIDHASGRLIINGALADFPFDNQQGEFIIKAHVSGVDLMVNPEWPMNQDIDADILQDKRSFAATVYQANLQGVLIDKLNLAIHDIGLGKEALLIHGNVDAPGAAVKAYVMASPLLVHLSKWQSLDILDSVNLDLHLDIPLYPERDEVLLQGTMRLADNQMSITTPHYPIVVDGLTGTIQFDEYGLTDGVLQGTLAGAPISLHAEFVNEPKPHTAVTIEGEASMDYLQKIIPSPFFTFITGHLNVTSLWTMYHDPNVFDHLSMDTSLEGIAIDLPVPFGKPAETSVPTRVDIDLKPNSLMDVYVRYNNRASCDLGLLREKNTVALQQGELRLGQGRAHKPKQANFNMVGSLATFDLLQWRHVLSKLPKEHSNSLMMDNLSDVDVRLKEVALFGQQYQDMVLKAHKLSKDDWSIQLDQKEVVADLHYLPQEKLISGHFERLLVEKEKKSSLKENETTGPLSPEDIPNLNVVIDALHLGMVDVGRVSLKSTSSKTHWLLDYCNIKAPNYQLNLQGDWTQANLKNTSTLQAVLAIDDLGKSLERWHVTPAVQARIGDVKFQGKWSAPFYDFSLSNVEGKLQMTLKDGRISHFDKETEEKLGLGKLLSILSLQTIPRRLKLDFSDLSEQGYSFDIFKGSFELNKGVMTTHDSYIDGPVAYARMSGDLDLSKHLYDVDLRITPYIMASLPVVVTIAGGVAGPVGPIAGLATWVASKIINKGMQKISGYTYKVSGPWLSPVVQQVSIDRSLH